MFAQQCKVEIEIVWKARGIRSDCEWDARTAKISHYANVQFIFEWGTEFDQPTSFDHLDQLEGIMQAKTQKPSEIIARTRWRMRNDHRSHFQWDMLVGVSG